MLLILDYLSYNTTRKGVVKLTLENMIIECGYKVDNHKGKSVKKFKSILSILQDNKIISCEKNIFDYKLKELIICNLTIDLTNKFTMLYDKEKNIILNQKIQKVDNAKLLFYFCYLKCRMYKRSKDDYEMIISGGRAETCWVSFKKINTDIDITDDTINKYNEILIKLNLIRIGNVGHWYYKDDPTKTTRDGANIYTLFDGSEENAQYNIEETIKYYKQLDINEDKVFIGTRKYKNNNKKINGFKGRIKYLEKHGKATPEQISMMNTLIEFNCDKTEKVFKIKSLLEKYPNTSISNIYLDFDKQERSEYYQEIETELELYDMDSDKFLVEKEYYDWVISNYSDDEKEFFINAVKKHKRENIKIKNDGFKNTVDDEDKVHKEIKEFFEKVVQDNEKVDFESYSERTKEQLGKIYDLNSVGELL